MSTRKTNNAELNKAIDSLGDAAQHVRNAVRGKLDGCLLYTSPSPRD